MKEGCRGRGSVASLGARPFNDPEWAYGPSGTVRGRRGWIFNYFGHPGAAMGLSTGDVATKS